MTTSGSPPRILALRFGSIGDIILITPLLRAIRARHGDAHIVVATKEVFRPLLSDNPNVDRVAVLAPDTGIRELAADLRGERFTHRLDLHDNLRSRALRWLIPGKWHGYPRHRFARNMLIRTKRNLYPVGTPPVPERFFAAARDLDVVPDGEPADFYLGSTEREHADQWLESHGLGIDRPLIVVAPMAAHATKRWPVENWQALVKRLTAANVDVVVVGGAQDAPTCTAVAEPGRQRALSAAGEMGLQGTGSLLARARVSVAGDTGAMHMSTAVRTPVVALFGPTVEALGYFPYRAEATVIQRGLACRPCSKMGGPACPLGHHRCLRDIDVEEVAGAVEHWL